MTDSTQPDMELVDSILKNVRPPEEFDMEEKMQDFPPDEIHDVKLSGKRLR